MTSVYNRSTKSRTAKVTMCIVLERTAPSPSTVDRTLRNRGCRRHRCRCLACLYDSLGFEVQERLPCNTASWFTDHTDGNRERRAMRKTFNQQGQFAQRAVRQDPCPSMGHLSNSWFSNHLTVPVTHRSLCTDEEMFQPGSLWVQRQETMSN